MDKAAKFYRPLMVLTENVSRTGNKAADGASLSNASLHRNFKRFWKQEPALRPTLRKAIIEDKGIVFIADKKKNDRFLLRHELTHAIRAKKGKLSGKLYPLLPFNIIEEVAANRAAWRKLKEVPKGFKTMAAIEVGTKQAIKQRPIQATIAAGGTVTGSAYLKFKKK